jgi:tRNA A-37 threonylcarbamoyl transferase component Bud32
LVKSLPPEIYAERVPRSKTFYGQYQENTEIVLRITNRGLGEAYNVKLKGMNKNVRIITGDTVGRIGVKARIDHPVTLRPNKSGEILLDELSITYEDGDKKEYSFSLQEIIFNVTTPQPEFKIEINSRRNVNPDEIFPVEIRIINIGKGRANQVNVITRIEPINSLLSGSLSNYFRRIDPGASIQIFYEIKSPDSGNLNIEFEDIEYSDLEGKKLNDNIPSQIINVQDSTPPPKREQDWPFEIRSRIDKYEIQEVLGEGGFAHVYLARDTMMRTNRAMKALKAIFVDDERVVENFINEARNAQKLRSPHIIQVFDVAGFQYKNKLYPYIIMEAVLGGTLRDRMTPGQPLATRNACYVGRDICDALLEAHQKNMIHQDIKPSNIFYDDAMVLWKLGDFGLAKIVQESEIVSDEGTASYMAPEKKKSNKSDIYSLGLVLREILTGTRRGSVQEIRKNSELREERTERLIEIIERMTDHRPSKRPDLKEVIDVLDTSTLGSVN